MQMLFSLEDDHAAARHRLPRLGQRGREAERRQGEWVGGRSQTRPYVVCVNINAHDSTLLSAVYFQVCKFTHPTELKGPRLREIAPTARGSQDTGSRNLAHAYEAWVTDANKKHVSFASHSRLTAVCQIPDRSLLRRHRVLRPRREDVWTLYKRPQVDGRQCANILQSGNYHSILFISSFNPNKRILGLSPPKRRI